LSRAQKRALKKEIKAEKTISKASKNQQKHAVSVRREDIEVVARVIHDADFGAVNNDGRPLGTDKTIEQVVKRNLGFVSAIQEHRSALLGSLAKERDLTSKNWQSQRSENDEAKLPDAREHMGDLFVAVLEKLGIHSASPTLAFNAPPTNSFGTPRCGKKTKAAIMQKLSAAIAGRHWEPREWKGKPIKELPAFGGMQIMKFLFDWQSTRRKSTGQLVRK
jgi:hypothetical protein